MICHAKDREFESHQLANPNSEQQVKDALTHSGLDPHTLVPEIVESSVSEPDNDIVTMLQRLQRMGIRVTIDDFCMGHASLRYQREFPVDTIVIDGKNASTTLAGKPGITPLWSLFFRESSWHVRNSDRISMLLS